MRVMFTHQYTIRSFSSLNQILPKFTFHTANMSSTPNSILTSHSMLFSVFTSVPMAQNQGFSSDGLSPSSVTNPRLQLSLLRSVIKLGKLGRLDIEFPYQVSRVLLEHSNQYNPVSGDSKWGLS